MRRLFAVVAVVASSLGIALTSDMKAAAVDLRPSALPGGFADTVLDNPPSNSLSGLTGIAPLAGDRALIMEKGGAVRVLGSDGKLVAADALNLSVCTGSEMGLLGAAADPGFNVNGYVYLYYTHNAGDCNSASGRFNRVSRFTMTANTIDPNSEAVLLDNIAAKGGNHDGGDLEVGQDGYLYVTIGDSGSNPRGAGDTAAEDLSLLNGKILRITTIGGVPADNPFVGDPSAAPCATAGIAAPTTVKCLEIFDWGLRNPYRFAFDTNTGATHFFINDVGEGTWEEVDEGGKGLNYGWNTREGACVTGSSTNCPPPPAQFTDPLTSYNHSSGCTYVTAGAFVPNGIWPAQFDNSYLFADGGCGKMWLRTPNGAVDYANPFAQTTGGIVDMAFITQGPDPALYYVTNGDSKVHKITYDAPASKNDSALAYTPLAAATRPYDTRFNIGVAPGTVRAGTTRYVDLGIDSSNGHTIKAALVNLTMVDSLGTGYVVASEGRTEHPPSSNLNVSSGEVAANTSIVPVDSSGNIVVFASVTTNVIVDVLGVFEAVDPGVSGGRFTALTPARLIDTRNPANTTTNAYTKSPVVNSVSTVNTVVGGKLGVPGAVKAVALIVTGVSAVGQLPGFTTVYPGGTMQPPTSNLNTNGNGDARPNLVIVPLGADASISIALQSTADVIVDVAGYFVDTTSPAGLYHVVAPSRQVDTRVPSGFGPLPIDGAATLNVGQPVPAGSVAVSQNLTMTRSVGPGFVTAYPSDQPRPLASNGNVSGPNQDHASLSFTKLSGAGGISYYSSGGTDLVVDITGYFQG
jgi:glucose/arabinose dehydrogenase